MQERCEEAREVGRGRDDGARGPRPRGARGASVAGGCEAADNAVVGAQGVPVRVAAGDPDARHEKLVSTEPGGGDDPAVQLALQRRPGRTLDDEPEKDIVRTGVGKALTGRRHRSRGECQADQLGRTSIAGVARSRSGAGTPRSRIVRQPRLCASNSRNVIRPPLERAREPPLHRVAEPHRCSATSWSTTPRRTSW